MASKAAQSHLQLSNANLLETGGQNVQDQRLNPTSTVTDIKNIEAKPINGGPIRPPPVALLIMGL